MRADGGPRSSTRPTRHFRTSLQLVRPAELAADPLPPGFPEPSPQRLVRRPAAPAPPPTPSTSPQRASKPSLAVADQVGGAAGPVARRSACRSPTPPAAPARTSRTATAARTRRCRRRSRASAASVSTPEPRDALLRRERLPERAEVRHLRPGEHDAERRPPPTPVRGAEQIDRPLLGAVVRQVPDDHFAGRDAPRRRAARRGRRRCIRPDRRPALAARRGRPARRARSPRRASDGVCTNTRSACRSSQRRCGAVYCRRVRSGGSVGSPRCRNGVSRNGTPRRRASRSPHAIGNEYGKAVAWTASSGPSNRPASRHIAGQTGLHGSGEALPAARGERARAL